MESPSNLRVMPEEAYQADDQCRASFFNAADEHFVVEHETRKENLSSSCHQISSETQIGSYSGVAQESQIEVVTIKCEPADVISSFETSENDDELQSTSLLHSGEREKVCSSDRFMDHRSRDRDCCSDSNVNDAKYGQDTESTGISIRKCYVVLQRLDVSRICTNTCSETKASASGRSDVAIFPAGSNTQDQECIGVQNDEKVHAAERPHQCSFCDKTFSKSKYKNCHERTHRDKPYLCSFCGKRFCTTYQYTLHERTHTGEKPFQCSFCDKKFKAYDVRKMHERTHTGEKPFQCSFCDKKFRTSGQNSVHERTHTGEKPYRCSFCDERFTQSVQKTLHERAHTGEMPFQCAFCDKKFVSRSQKTLHERSHTGEKPHHCAFCDKKFVRCNQKTLHERTHTGERPFQCSFCDKKFISNKQKTSHEKTHRRIAT